MGRPGVQKAPQSARIWSEVMTGQASAYCRAILAAALCAGVMGFAPAEAPRYAIAVLVENGGDLGSEATGGRVAAPIAGSVLATLLQQP